MAEAKALGEPRLRPGHLDGPLGDFDDGKPPDGREPSGRKGRVLWHHGDKLAQVLVPPTAVRVFPESLLNRNP